MLSYLIKTNVAFGTTAFSFSLMGIFLSSATVYASPLDSVNFEHVFGHVFWGLVAGIVSFSLRYFLVTGMFAIVLDSDHLVHFIFSDVVARMGHSIPFAMISVIVLIRIFGKKNYLLGACGFAAVFSHISFDTFLGSGDFPIFIPFSEEFTNFGEYDWIYLQVMAIGAILFTKILQDKKIVQSKIE